VVRACQLPTRIFDYWSWRSTYKTIIFNSWI